MQIDESPKGRLHPIIALQENSPAKRAGARVGDALLTIDGQIIRDDIDYQYLSATRDPCLVVVRAGEKVTLPLKKGEHEPLGLTFAQPLMSAVRTCANRCMFCFIDQMPPHRRDTLYVKDDDWRLSLKFGNYVTLTNVSDTEFERIIARRVSPLYISVHASDPQVRCAMMGNRTAGRLGERLAALKAAGLAFHAQVVLCPGVNDGEVLERTLADLCALHPSARSVALVPVGITRYREGLRQITPYDASGAQALLAQVAPWQARCLQQMGTRFAFCADEFYCLSGQDIPPSACYEDYGQIENGVGMLRTLEEEYAFAMEEPPAKIRKRRVLIACGTSVAPFLRALVGPEPLPGVAVEVVAVANDYFGHTVTVSGLLTGGDLLRALKGSSAQEVLLTGSALREGEDIFLDDMTLEQLRRELGVKVTPVPNDGYGLMMALAGMEGAI